MFPLLQYSLIMMCTNNQINYGAMVILVCLHITLPHYHRYADASESTDLLKIFAWYILLNVCLRFKSIV